MESNDSIEMQVNELIVGGASQYNFFEQEGMFSPRLFQAYDPQSCRNIFKNGDSPNKCQFVIGEVETNSGKNLAVCIDFELATQADKDALNPEDVKKVEYL